jgi:hypothetical protein
VLDVRKSPELQAAILGMKRANKEVRLEIYKRSRAQLGNQWVPALQSRASGAFEQRVLVKGARTKVSTEGFSMVAATSNKKLSGGLVPSSEYAGAEWGARTRRDTFQQRSPKGTPYTVTKTINRQFRGRQKEGQIVMESASKLGTRLVALWVQIIVTTYRDAMNGEIV